MMDDVPEDIKQAAFAVVERGYNEGLLDAVERALMTERERNRADMQNLLAIIASRNAALERYENGEMVP